ncbi:MAG TPA: hypothetical protein VMT00_12510 [Thermoanaerobaculia bacterium]|nr:hypothetical protein [Thermoanaerobaculia bacterium]
MRREVTLLVLITLVTSGCTAYRQQRIGPDTAATRPISEARALAPDPELVSRFAQQSLALKQAAIIDQLDLLKTELAGEGKYDCCVMPGCSECVINSGECHCRRVIERDGPCCGECTQAWIEGRGNIPGVDREQILEHLGCVRELYEKPVPEGETAPGRIVPPAE